MKLVAGLIKRFFLSREPPAAPHRRTRLRRAHRSRRRHRCRLMWAVLHAGLLAYSLDDARPPFHTLQPRPLSDVQVYGEDVDDDVGEAPGEGVPPPPPRQPTCPLSTFSLRDGDAFWTSAASPAPLPSSAANCTWYGSSSCCTPDDVARVSRADPELELLGTTRRCRALLLQLMCSPCSPRQEEIFGTMSLGAPRVGASRGFDVPVLRVCPGFCDRLFTDCGAARMTQRQMLSEGPVGTRVDEVYNSSRAFCRGAGLHVVADDRAASAPEGDGAAMTCFSAATSRRRQVRSHTAQWGWAVATALGALWQWRWITRPLRL